MDLAEIVAGLKPGREREDERTMAANIGLALEDMAVASEIYARAREHGIGVCAQTNPVSTGRPLRYGAGLLFPRTRGKVKRI